MKALCVLALVCAAALPLPSFAKVKVPPFGCASFMEDFTKAAQPNKVTFERPLNITRGFFGDDEGVEVRVLATGENVEGTLKCHGDEFRRFEVRVAAPVDEKLETTLKAYEQAALIAAFRWDRPKAEMIVNAMSSDAAEYLKASVQRGDTFLSGKVEYHQGDTLDLGLIWTDTDHTFIIASQTSD
ncbi:hypothetical protein [Lichenihabitans psoromatis]|uniref:hypothetical protein n=1 Tax=Lichenihabitans psoromatis TaxID=2528642 RepID=UPI00103833CA|nr:hypothetical protein [Lichenihabitans psoromatis]